MGLLWAQEGTTEMSEYWFKPKPEAIRAILLAAFIAGLMFLQGVDFTALNSLGAWQALVVGLLAGAAQAAVAAALAQFGSGGFGDGPKPEAAE